jgi:hypothetical protein
MTDTLIPREIKNGVILCLVHAQDRKRDSTGGQNGPQTKTDTSEETWKGCSDLEYLKMSKYGSEIHITSYLEITIQYFIAFYSDIHVSISACSFIFSLKILSRMSLTGIFESVVFPSSYNLPPGK